MNLSNIRLQARSNLNGNLGISILAAFIAGVFGAGIAGGSFQLNIELDQWIELPQWIDELIDTYLYVTPIVLIVRLAAGGVVQLGYAKFLLKQYACQDFDLKDLFSQLHRFKDGFLQTLLRSVYVFLWTLLLLVPGIIAGYSYSMTPFIMADYPNLSANDAISNSKYLMDGHKMELFLLDLSFIGWEILCVFTLGIGYIFLVPYKNAAYAAFYCQICNEA